ncbi:TRAP transporter small permease subunit [Microvirga tunisiensis]|uniref:TRAP transporter small permease subunit n=2 Tax=Pannonibacter tanglangensis TaxID=2750084 RepID=A0ABW9ZDX4_9HYPH|nr:MULTISPECIES: TRAP transporter small permease [unclassified Pannonibacter]NBN62619.1 TRAP transporter small permease subunit [Pannonibacter sp. XCT-34]NBN78274.1 TRAP transporter small permease subunit [Pannonibacter sp. XCT-53]
MASLLRKAITAWALFGALFILAIVLVTTLNVSAFAANRVAALFGGTVAGLSGYEDFVRLAVSVTALSFIPYCQLKRGHVVVDLFVQSMPKAVRAGLDKLWLATTAGLALFLAYWMWVGLNETMADQTRTAILGWQEWPWYGPGVVSMILWALVCLLQLVEGEPHG